MTFSHTAAAVLFGLASCGGSSAAPDSGGVPPSDGRTTSDAGTGTGSGSGSGVTTHEPSGMSVQIDTGPITEVLPAGWMMFSPATMTAEGESSANLVRVPDGTGLRLLYNPSLEGGYSPVRFGTPIGSGGSSTYYQRWRVRTVANWAGPRNGNGVKQCEPQTLDQGPGDGSGTNDILMMRPVGGNPPFSAMCAMEGLQGPNGMFANLDANHQTSACSLTDGQWHVDERIFVAESSPGAGDGQYYAYLDGALVASYTDVHWLASTSQWGFTYLTFDPTFGGAPADTHPNAGDFWDFDQLYVSTK